MDIKNIAETLHPLERKVFPFIKENQEFKKLVELSKLKDVEVMRALQWLSNKDLIKIEESSKDIITLDKNGEEYLKKGLPEKRFLKEIKTKPKTINELKKILGEELNICIGTLKKRAAITLGKEISITKQGIDYLNKESLEELFLKKSFPINLESIKPEEKFAVDNLRNRKNIIKFDKQKTKTIFLLPKAKKLKAIDLKGKYTDKITPKLIQSGKWKTTQIRKYDVTAKVPKIFGGKKHFVNQAVDYIKRIWLDLGFKEMTGPKVMTSYWDLDSLFVPQDHPARQMQDTFFIKGKGKLPKDYKKIKDVHENGSNTGSIGWRSKWSEDIASQLMLITHDTYRSAQVLDEIKEEDLPVKTFQIMKVFRNEALDWKHLFEFYQIGGIVVDKNVNLRHLLGYLKLFFKKMGYLDVRIRPGYFPYVEPGAEIEAFHPVKKEWVELGGSGIFRPEVTKPLLGFECPVLAWGFGLGRTVSEYWNINDIRELYKNDILQMQELKHYMR